MNRDTLVFRLRERARIRRSIPTRKSVQEGMPDRIADLLEEAVEALENHWYCSFCKEHVSCLYYNNLDDMGRCYKCYVENCREVEHVN